LDQRGELTYFFINGHGISSLSVVKLVVVESWVDGIPHEALQVEGGTPVLKADPGTQR